MVYLSRVQPQLLSCSRNPHLSLSLCSRKLINISSIENWDIDQDIVTYSLLTSKLCSLQASNKVWTKLSLAPAPFRDQATCWHGSGIYEDCNNGLKMRNAMIKYQVGGKYLVVLSRNIVDSSIGSGMLYFIV